MANPAPRHQRATRTAGRAKRKAGSRSTGPREAEQSDYIKHIMQFLWESAQFVINSGLDLASGRRLRPGQESARRVPGAACITSIRLAPLASAARWVVLPLTSERRAGT